MVRPVGQGQSGARRHDGAPGAGPAGAPTGATITGQQQGRYGAQAAPLPADGLHLAIPSKVKIRSHDEAGFAIRAHLSR